MTHAPVLTEAQISRFRHVTAGEILNRPNDGHPFTYFDLETDAFTQEPLDRFESSNDNLEAFAGRGIYYNATFMEAQRCTSERVILIGGDNSAGQAAVFLSQNTSGVTMLVRSRTLADTMSRYLVQRIEENPDKPVEHRVCVLPIY